MERRIPPNIQELTETALEGRSTWRMTRAGGAPDNVVTAQENNTSMYILNALGKELPDLGWHTMMAAPCDVDCAILKSPEKGQIYCKGCWKTALRLYSRSMLMDYTRCPGCYAEFTLLRYTIDHMQKCAAWQELYGTG